MVLPFVHHFKRNAKCTHFLFYCIDPQRVCVYPADHVCVCGSSIHPYDILMIPLSDTSYSLILLVCPSFPNTMHTPVECRFVLNSLSYCGFCFLIGFCSIISANRCHNVEPPFHLMDILKCCCILCSIDMQWQSNFHLFCSQ
jgi:hypothetical protein